MADQEVAPRGSLDALDEGTIKLQRLNWQQLEIG